ncbi:MAG: peptidoglycan DD-metalloendopeptidase family protein [Bacteroidota bacterium]
MIYYLVFLHLCLAGLYGLYHFKLASLPNFRLNRLFLLSIPVFCLLIPLLEWKVPAGIEDEIQQWTHDYWEPIEESLAFSEGVSPQKKALTNWKQLILGLYALGMLGQLFKIARTWLAAYRILCRQEGQQKLQNSIYLSPELAFSCTFFHKIYLGQDYHSLPAVERQYLVAHEQVHARLGHSWDLLFLHLFKLIAWCNPLAQKLILSAQNIHEFQADQIAAPEPTDFLGYTRLLLRLQQRAQHLPFAAFHSHPLTLRIKMLKQNQISHPPRWSRYLLSLPLLSMLVSLSAFKMSHAPAMAEGVPILDPMVSAFSPMLVANEDSHIPTLRPVDGKITSGFGMRMHPIKKVKMKHTGTDFHAPIGTPIKAAGSGTILKTGNMPKGYGIWVSLDHGNGYVTRYAQLSKVAVQAGQAVKQGDIIAYSGNSGLSTAPHLHYEVKLNGKHIDPASLFED